VAPAALAAGVGSAEISAGAAVSVVPSGTVAVGAAATGSAVSTVTGAVTALDSTPTLLVTGTWRARTGGVDGRRGNAGRIALGDSIAASGVTGSAAAGSGVVAGWLDGGGSGRSTSVKGGAGAASAAFCRSARYDPAAAAVQVVTINAAANDRENMAELPEYPRSEQLLCPDYRPKSRGF
jgi:hypothetical protein